MSLCDGPSPNNGLRQGTHLNLLDLFQCYPIFDRLCAHMPIAGSINLTRTCRTLSHLYQTLLDLQQWNVDRDLLRFVKDPRRFRTQLGKCDGLISGSFALQFLSGCFGKALALTFLWKIAERPVNSSTTWSTSRIISCLERASTPITDGLDLPEYDFHRSSRARAFPIYG